MYHAIVRSRVRKQFEKTLPSGDVQAIIAPVAPDVVHHFAGRHALGGTRRSRDQFATWFERFQRLFPRVHFAVDQLAVSGWPWRTVVTVRWRDWGHAADGEPYENEGCHVITMRWGRAKQIEAYLDTELLSRALERMAAAGFEDAAAAPIDESPAPAAGTAVAAGDGRG